MRLCSRACPRPAVGERDGDPCPAAALQQPVAVGRVHAQLGGGLDMVFRSFVEPGTLDPARRRRRSPRGRRQRRRSARRRSSSRSTTWLEFVCSLDDGPFEPCSSPKTYDKLKRKKHHFEVTATDAVGQRRPEPGDLRLEGQEEAQETSTDRDSRRGKTKAGGNCRPLSVCRAESVGAGPRARSTASCRWSERPRRRWRRPAHRRLHRPRTCSVRERSTPAYQDPSRCQP